MEPESVLRLPEESQLTLKQRDISTDQCVISYDFQQQKSFNITHNLLIGIGRDFSLRQKNKKSVGKNNLFSIIQQPKKVFRYDSQKFQSLGVESLMPKRYLQGIKLTNDKKQGKFSHHLHEKQQFPSIQFPQFRHESVGMQGEDNISRLTHLSQFQKLLQADKENQSGGKKMPNILSKKGRNGRDISIEETRRDGKYKEDYIRNNKTFTKKEQQKSSHNKSSSINKAKISSNHYDSKNQTDNNLSRKALLNSFKNDMQQENSNDTELRKENSLQNIGQEHRVSLFDQKRNEKEQKSRQEIIDDQMLQIQSQYTGKNNPYKLNTQPTSNQFNLGVPSHQKLNRIGSKTKLKQSSHNKLDANTNQRTKTDISTNEVKQHSKQSKMQSKMDRINQKSKSKEANTNRPKNSKGQILQQFSLISQKQRLKRQGHYTPPEIRKAQQKNYKFKQWKETVKQPPQKKQKPHRPKPQAQPTNNYRQIQSHTPERKRQENPIKKTQRSPQTSNPKSKHRKSGLISKNTQMDIDSHEDEFGLRRRNTNNKKIVKSQSQKLKNSMARNSINFPSADKKQKHQKQHDQDTSRSKSSRFRSQSKKKESLLITTNLDRLIQQNQSLSRISTINKIKQPQIQQHEKQTQQTNPNPNLQQLLKATENSRCNLMTQTINNIQVDLAPDQKKQQSQLVKQTINEKQSDLHSQYRDQIRDTSIRDEDKQFKKNSSSKSSDFFQCNLKQMSKAYQTANQTMNATKYTFIDKETLNYTRAPILSFIYQTKNIDRFQPSMQRIPKIQCWSSNDAIFQQAIKVLLNIDIWILERTLQPFFSQSKKIGVWLYCHGRWRLSQQSIEKGLEETYEFIVKRAIDQLKIEYSIENVLRVISGVRVLRMNITKPKVFAELEYSIKKGHYIHLISKQPKLNKIFPKLTGVQIGKDGQYILQIMIEGEKNWVKLAKFLQNYDGVLVISHRMNQFWSTKPILNRSSHKNAIMIRSSQACHGSLTLFYQDNSPANLQLYKESHDKVLKLIGKIDSKPNTNGNLYFEFKLYGNYYLFLNVDIDCELAIQSTKKILLSDAEYLFSDSLRNQQCEFVQLIQKKREHAIPLDVMREKFINMVMKK